LDAAVWRGDREEELVMRSQTPLLATLCALLTFVVVASACALGGGGTTGGGQPGGGTTGARQASPTATSVPNDPAHLVALNAVGDADALAPDGKTKLLHIHINGAQGNRYTGHFCI
jgi:hypothetical protein